MPELSLLEHGHHVMTVCNACRYCEQYCPVFPAMENRVQFGVADLTYLANLCHNCGECLYACQYAPPHEFGIDVPRTMARLRVSSYEQYAWPAALGAAFRRHAGRTATAVILAVLLLMVAVTTLSPEGLRRLGEPVPGGNFYVVVPHTTMMVVFGSVSAFVVVALGIGLGRFWRDVRATAPVPVTLATLLQALRDAGSLKHLHGHEASCVTGEETRSPWRRWFHHATFYGFLLCFASTSVAAVYHNVFGWVAPYAYLSLPVVLGTIGGVGLIVGPVGLMVMRRRRDPALSDPDQDGLDWPFLLFLLLTGATGLLLLGFRHTSALGWLLLVHLAAVLAFFMTLPYGKFVHGLYRLLALIQYTAESAVPPSNHHQN